MARITGTERIVVDAETDPVAGRIVWSPAKSIWIGTMTLVGMVGAPLCFSWDALALFFGLCGVTLALGHSVGMHRRLIHGSFGCPRWLEYVCVYLGTLVGMAGPIGMMRTHDMRDWAQRQSACHDYFYHRKNFWHDAWWQLHCELKLVRPPEFRLEPRVARDRIYFWMERLWLWQQLPWAVLFFVLGGWSWVVWGICARVSVCVIGHWLVGHYAHREGPQSWIVEGAVAQGHNVRIAGLISMGESWHNNHHAFPGSAKLGLFPGQVDPGWWLIRTFEFFGLAWAIRTPATMAERKELRRAVNANDGGCTMLAGMEKLLGLGTRLTRSVGRSLGRQLASARHGRLGSSGGTASSS